MALAKVSALRSKDPNTQVGAVIVNDNNRVIGLGYNGMPQGNDDDFPWAREGNEIDTKYPYVIHAEINAMLNSFEGVRNTRVFVTMYPCSNCAKLLVQAGIKSIIYLHHPYAQTDDAKIAHKIFSVGKVEVTKMDDFNLGI